MKSIMEQAPVGPNPKIFWIITPGGDLYPEQLNVPPLMGLGLCDDDGNLVRSTLEGGQRVGQIHEFDALPSPMQFQRLAYEAKSEQALIDPAPGDRENPGIPTLDSGYKAEEEEEEPDARVMTIDRRANGVRHKDFKSAVEELSQSSWDGWPLSGPRTAVWCVRYISETDGHPTAHYTRWRYQASLSLSDAGVGDLESGLKMIEYAMCFDRVNIGELACFELLLRKLQLIELKYKNRSLKADGEHLHEEEHLYLGHAATRGQLMVNPDLEQYVASEIAKDCSVMKEKRKLLEERRLARPKGKGKDPKDPKGKGKGKDAVEEG